MFTIHRIKKIYEEKTRQTKKKNNDSWKKFFKHISHNNNISKEIDLSIYYSRIVIMYFSRANFSYYSLKMGGTCRSCFLKIYIETTSQKKKIFRKRKKELKKRNEGAFMVNHTVAYVIYLYSSV